MTESLKIESHDPPAHLTLRLHSGQYFLAEFSNVSLHATARVDTYLLEGLGNFFSGLATDWKGWVGQREWGTLAGELKLRAKSDHTGHVYLHVQLIQEAPEWEVGANLVLEAGQLEPLAAEALAFERLLARAT